MLVSKTMNRLRSAACFRSRRVSSASSAGFFKRIVGNSVDGDPGAVCHTGGRSARLKTYSGPLLSMLPVQLKKESGYGNRANAFAISSESSYVSASFVDGL